MKHEYVKDWMSRDVITITPDVTLPEAHQLMTENDIRRLPVVKDGRLVGIVTLGDVREAEPSGATSLSIWELNYVISRLTVEKIMTPEPRVIVQDATIREASKMMLDYKISGLPVVDDDGRLVGIITESDIFRMVVEDWHSD
ncbi:MAG TPA: CBS domain-containing protein [Anaerolineae bacterium]|nr:CBS domain-containing protein [Anaerolineae bacterium]